MAGTQRWRSEQQNSAYLLAEGKPLQEALLLQQNRLFQLEAEETEFIQASNAKARLKRWTRRGTLAMLCLLTVTAVTMGARSFNAEQQAQQWRPMLGERTPRDLPGQTATIVGWGPIGQQLASLLQALGLKVVAVRQQAGPQTPLQADAVERVTFEQLQQVLPRTDWLILACPLTDKTRQLVNAHALAALPKGAHLINVARGEVVDQSALVAALQSGHLGGAFLDVFQHEPLQRDSPLWAMPQVMVTPHAAGHSDGNEKRVSQMFLDNLRRFASGQPLHQVVR